MIGEPDLLLLDEPTSGVDIKTRDDVLHLLADLNRDGMTIVLTTHELNSVAAHLPWVVCINGRVIAEGDPDEIFTSEILGTDVRRRSPRRAAGWDDARRRRRATPPARRAAASPRRLRALRTTSTTDAPHVHEPHTHR